MRQRPRQVRLLKGEIFPAVWQGFRGKVAHVKLKEDGQSVTEVIGGGKAAGICGTGIIDLTAELLRHGLLDEHGTFTEQYFEKGYPVAEGVLFTQKDVRELQMAKAAIRAGIEILMKKAGWNRSRLRPVIWRVVSVHRSRWNRRCESV